MKKLIYSKAGAVVINVVFVLIFCYIAMLTIVFIKEAFGETTLGDWIICMLLSVASIWGCVGYNKKRKEFLED